MMVTCPTPEIADALIGAERHEHDRRRLRVDFGDDGRVDALRQVAQHRVDLVAHVLRGDVTVLVELEGDRDLREAFHRGRAELVDAFDRIDRAFDLVADIGLDLFRRRAVEARRDEHERQVDVRELIEAEARITHEPEHHDHQHQDAGEYRALHADLS